MLPGTYRSSLGCLYSKQFPDYDKGSIGKGLRRRVDPNTYLPSNWQQFVRIAENISKLFELLAYYLSSVESNKPVVTTKGQSEMANQSDYSGIASCAHDEVNTRRILHAAHAVKKSSEKLQSEPLTLVW